MNPVKRKTTILGLLLLLSVQGQAQSGVDALAVVGEFDRMARTSLWPGFEPARVPLLIYDGKHTFLVHHPRPPEEFQPHAGRTDVRVFPGRHGAARANSSVELGGVTSASVLLKDTGTGKERGWAAVLMHEAFHVFQRERHPKWTANEVDLFVYPLEDADLLFLRRLESEALRRALTSTDNKLRACWAGAALHFRQERFSRMPQSAAAYERATELNEGLANFVQYAALERPAAEALTEAEFPPQEIRQRGYASGQALAALLESFRKGWKEELEKGSPASLDELLAERLPASSTGCEFPANLQNDLRTRAQADIEDLRRRMRQRREGFLSRPGWRLVVTAAQGEPLFPQAFDPLNVERLQAGEVLHGRWIKLGNASGEIEVLDREALTEAAGSHPLFEGVRRLSVSGLEHEPAVEQEGESVVVRTAGVNARFRRARVARSGETLEITLAKSGVN